MEHLPRPTNVDLQAIETIAYLLLLYELVRDLKLRANPQSAQNELLLWCDTMCCPISPKDAKDRALKLMRKTYEEASHVLVLDATLRPYKTGDQNAETICTRIFLSRWMRRLWTLQEGALPAESKLWFQFLDKAINLNPLWQSVLHTFQNKIGHRGISSEIMNRLRGFMTFFHGPLDEPQETGADLALVDAAIQHRSVSVPTDEPLLIGNLLNLDANWILNGSEDSRVYRMWSAMPAARRGIPKNIVFRLGPRLKREGYRWAPSTLLYYEITNGILQTMRESEDNQGLPTCRGLQVSLAGYTLSWPDRPRGLPSNPWNIIQDKGMFYMKDEQGVWYLVHQRKSCTSPAIDGDFLSNNNLCDVIRSKDDLRILHLQTDFQVRTGHLQSTSLLVKLVEAEDGINFVKSYMHLSVGPVQSNSKVMFEAAYRCAKQLADTEPARKLAALNDEAVDMGHPEYKTLFDSLEPEILRITMLEVNKLGLAAASQSAGNNPSMLLGAITALIYIGHYAITETVHQSAQRWCVD
ncbi:hypothetical protein P7C71_g5278, partial [Lecanoromycetidae sp. Uapishka_2]